MKIPGAAVSTWTVVEKTWPLLLTIAVAVPGWSSMGACKLIWLGET